MPLPKLETNKYTTTLPSTGETIEFRPFLVKEEKILLVAQETEDQAHVVKSIKDIINACTFEKLDINELKTYDIEHLFLQLRIKSIDETSSVTIMCPHCQTPNFITINLEEAFLDDSKKDTIENKVQINKNVGMTLKPLTIDEAATISNEPENFCKILALCIDTIYDENTVYNTKDFSEKDLTEFVDSFSRKEVQAIEKFISSQPTVKYEKTFKCQECQKDIDVKLSGLQDFFG